MKMISDSIGWDGVSFFCRRCGRAGYSKMAQVKGHLAMCPGRAVAKGAVPQLAAASCSPVANAPFEGLQVLPTASQQQQLQPILASSYGQLDDRVKQLENEYNHMLVERNLPANDWFSSNKNMLIIMAVSVVALYLVTRNSQCQCDNGSKVVKNGMASFGEKALAKFVDRGITKGVDSLFGK